MYMKTWAWKPLPSTVAQSVINEIWNIVRWLPGSPKSHHFTTDSCPVSNK